VLQATAKKSQTVGPIRVSQRMESLLNQFFTRSIMPHLGTIFGPNCYFLLPCLWVALFPETSQGGFHEGHRGGFALHTLDQKA